MLGRLSHPGASSPPVRVVAPSVMGTVQSYSCKTLFSPADQRPHFPTNPSSGDPPQSLGRASLDAGVNVSKLPLNIFLVRLR